ncbi:hypothetical protein ACROYT_G015251 [Oculina patagonica]
MAVKGTGTRGFLPGYFDSLKQKECRERYAAKLNDINGQDPYKIPRKEWLDDFDTWPNVTYIHVGMYLLFIASPYTKEQLMNYKSLDCYQNFANGWVREGFSRKFGENRLLIGKLKDQNSKILQTINATQADVRNDRPKKIVPKRVEIVKDALKEQDMPASIKGPEEEDEGLEMHGASEEDLEEDACVGSVKVLEKPEEIEVIAIEPAGRSVPAENPTQVEQVKVSCFYFIAYDDDTKRNDIIYQCDVMART